jgi:hypothetical protein
MCGLHCFVLLQQRLGFVDAGERVEVRRRREGVGVYAPGLFWVSVASLTAVEVAKEALAIVCENAFHLNEPTLFHDMGAFLVLVVVLRCIFSKMNY